MEHPGVAMLGAGSWNDFGETKAAVVFLKEFVGQNYVCEWAGLLVELR